MCISRVTHPDEMCELFIGFMNLQAAEIVQLLLLILHQMLKTEIS